MPLESGSYISDLVAANPAHSDPLSQTDAHIRLLKSLILATFPNINSVVNASDEQLNSLITGTVPLANGTATAPSLSFLSEAGLGLYRSASGVISVSNGGMITGNGTCPTGMIADFLQNTVPIGWYELNGQQINRNGPNAGLFALYGTTYGAGDGSTTFNLPNLNNRYRRSRGTWTQGTFLADAIKSHTVQSVIVSGGDHSHTATVNDPGHSHTYTISAVLAPFTASGAGQLFFNQGSATTSASATGITVSNANSGTLSMSGAGVYTGDTETRPLTVVVTTCVKF